MISCFVCVVCILIRLASPRAVVHSFNLCKLWPLYVWQCLLGSTAVDDGWLDLMLDLTRARASRFKFLHNVHALLISDLTEDDVLAIQPGGNDGGDEELRAIAVRRKNIQRHKRLLGIMAMTHVFGPALAMDSMPGLVWARLKFSSANFSP